MASLSSEHVERMKTMVSTTYGVPTDQVCAWDCLDRETQFQIAKHAGLTADFVTSFSWVAMPLEAHKKLYKSYTKRPGCLKPRANHALN